MHASTTTYSDSPLLAYKLKDAACSEMKRIGVQKMKYFGAVNHPSLSLRLAASFTSASGITCEDQCRAGG